MKTLSVLLMAMTGGLSMTEMAQAQTWNQLVDRYFDEGVYYFNPSAATQTGFHNRDGELEDLSGGGVRKQITVLREFEKEVNAFGCGKRIRISIRGPPAMRFSSS